MTPLSGPTPMTDAALLRYTGGELVTFPKGLHATVDADFARNLERIAAEAVRALEEIIKCAIRDPIDRETIYVNTVAIQLAQEALARIKAAKEQI